MPLPFEEKFADDEDEDSGGLLPDDHDGESEDDGGLLPKEEISDGGQNLEDDAQLGVVEDATQDMKGDVIDTIIGDENQENENVNEVD